MHYDKFDMFLKNRQSLLYQYQKGDLNKNEFIDMNFRLINKLGIKPFNKIDNIKKAVYNYQYYNVMAKYYYTTAIFMKDKNKKELFRKSNNYYHKKDVTTLNLLKLINFDGIKAYFVKVKSDNLKNKLFEIVIDDPDLLVELDMFPKYNDMNLEHLVMHSKSPWLLKILREENVFLETKKKSVTDSYINQKY